MLTKDLIRARLSGDTVKPQFVKTDAPEILRYAEALILLYGEGTGATAAELDESAAALAAAFLAANAVASPTLSLSVDRERVYLGDSVVARVTLEDGDQNPPPPAFSGGTPSATVEYLGPQSSFSQRITLINGRRKSVVESSTVFTFLFTPTEAGVFETGAVSAMAGGRKLECPSRRVEVVAPEDLDFAKASLSSPEKSAIVESAHRKSPPHSSTSRKTPG